MKTAKQLHDIFISERFKGGTRFYHFVHDLIYKGHTTKDRTCMRYKLNPEKFKGTFDECKKLGLNFEEMRVYNEMEHKQTGRRIESRFEKYRIELNNFLQERQEQYEKDPFNFERVLY